MPSERRTQAARRKAYAEYIASPQWAAVRAAYWATTDYGCARCGSTEKLHVHHMTYERFTKELLSDLIGLCEKCHSLVHDVHRREGGNLMDVTLRVVRTKRVTKKPAAPKKKKPKAPYVPLKPIIPDLVVTRRPIPKASKAAKIKANDDAYNAALKRRAQLEGK